MLSTMTLQELKTYAASVQRDYFAALNYTGDGREERIKEQRARYHAIQDEALKRSQASCASQVAAMTDRVWHEANAVVRQDGLRILVYHKHETNPLDKGEYIGFISQSPGDFEMLPRPFDAVHQEDNLHILTRVRQILNETKQPQERHNDHRTEHLDNIGIGQDREQLILFASATA